MAKQHLIAAKKILQERGWTNGADLFNPMTGCVCLLGAVAVAHGWEPDPEQIYKGYLFFYTEKHQGPAYDDVLTLARILLPATSLFPGLSVSTVYGFSDKQKSIKPVLDLLDRAIEVTP